MGDAVVYWDAPHPPPSDFQVLPAAQSGREASGSREPVWEELGGGSQELNEPVGGRWPVKVNFRQRGGHPWNQAKPEGRRGKGKA